MIFYSRRDENAEARLDPLLLSDLGPGHSQAPPPVLHVPQEHTLAPQVRMSATAIASEPNADTLWVH